MRNYLTAFCFTYPRVGPPSHTGGGTGRAPPGDLPAPPPRTRSRRPEPGAPPGGSPAQAGEPRPGRSAQARDGSGAPPAAARVAIHDVTLPSPPHPPRLNRTLLRARPMLFGRRGAP